MQFPHHALIGEAVKIPVPDPTPIISYSPVVLPAPGRAVDLQLRVIFPAPSPSKPAPTSALPIVLLAHGAGPSNWLNSLDGDTPLAEFYAAHGFAVLQPTLLDSKFLGLERPGNDDPDFFWWQTRARDFGRILDALPAIEAAVPGLPSLDRARVAIVGHSYGGTTASSLLGATNADPRPTLKGNADPVTNFRDERIKVGVVLAGTGAGGDDLAAQGKAILPFYGPDFAEMKAPALVVYGDGDATPMLTGTARGADWHADAYLKAPGPKDLLTVKGAHHGLGGVSGWDAAETKDEGVERLIAVQRLTWAYLWSQLHEGDTAWAEASKAFEGLGSIGTLEHKA